MSPLDRHAVDVSLVLQSGQCQVRMDELHYRRSTFDEVTPARSPAERLDAKSTATRVEIENPSIFDILIL